MTTITMCPKCDSSNHMSWNGDYAVCLQCGYEDYNNPIPRPSPKAKGLRYLAHYIGQYTPFKGLEVPIRVKGHATTRPSAVARLRITLRSQRGVCFIPTRVVRVPT